MILLYALLAIVAHEAAHALTARTLGYHVSFVANRRKLAVRITAEHSMPAWHDLLIAASGPLLNIGMMLIAVQTGEIMQAFVAGSLGLLSLVPYPRYSDGGHIVSSVRTLLT